MPYNESQNIETTIGQLNFFKWAIEHNIIEYIHEHYSEIESDMNARNTISKKRNYTERSTSSMSSVEDEISEEPPTKSLDTNNKTRKRREELSISACKCIKKETVKILVKFS
jgi:hypothetical protein